MQIKKVKKIIAESSRIVGFTGAGISTESGISDYRSQGGIWERFQPVYIDEFMKHEEKRILYWQRKQELWESLSKAEPNKGHLFFKDLHDKGKLSGIITQNIDGLHEKSSIPGKKIINIHGTNLITTCLKCGYTLPTSDVMAELDLDKGAPVCPEKGCKGFLKPFTVSFGQNLNRIDLDKAEILSGNCDLMIVVGSTLVVQPAASFPVIAKNNNAKLIIINMTETPLDNLADVVVSLKMGDFTDLYNS